MRLSASFARAVRPLALGAALLAAGTASPALAAGDGALTNAQTEAVKALIRETLLNDPEILRDAINALRAHDERQEKERASQMITELGDLLKAPEGLPALGNPDGDVTVVEFSDYNCGYCKRVFPVLWDKVNADGNIKLYVMEYPILGDSSVYAARAALAAPQDKYEDFHRALMDHKGKLDEDVVMSIAKDQDIDTDALTTAMKDPQVDAKIARSFQIAQALGITGTPAFIIGDTLVPGAMPAESLDALVKQARESGK